MFDFDLINMATLVLPVSQFLHLKRNIIIHIAFLFIGIQLESLKYDWTGGCYSFCTVEGC